MAIWSYGMHKIDNDIDKISEKLNIGGDILENIGPEKRIMSKKIYKTIPFPFKEIPAPKFE